MTRYPRAYSFVAVPGPRRRSGLGATDYTPGQIAPQTGVINGKNVTVYRADQYAQNIVDLDRVLASTDKTTLVRSQQATAQSLKSKLAYGASVLRRIYAGESYRDLGHTRPPSLPAGSSGGSYLEPTDHFRLFDLLSKWKAATGQAVGTGTVRTVGTMSLAVAAAQPGGKAAAQELGTRLTLGAGGATAFLMPANVNNVATARLAVQLHTQQLTTAMDTANVPNVTAEYNELKSQLASLENLYSMAKPASMTQADWTSIGTDIENARTVIARADTWLPPPVVTDALDEVPVPDEVLAPDQREFLSRPPEEQAQIMIAELNAVPEMLPVAQGGPADFVESFSVAVRQQIEQLRGLVATGELSPETVAAAVQAIAVAERALRGGGGMPWGWIVLGGLGALVLWKMVKS